MDNNTLNNDEIKQKIEGFTQFMRGLFNNPDLYVPQDMADRYGISEEFCEKKHEKHDRQTTPEERLKILMDTGEYDFIKNIPREQMWKLTFLNTFVWGDEEVNLNLIRAEMLALINKSRTPDYSNGVMNCVNIIDRYIEGSE